MFTKFFHFFTSIVIGLFFIVPQQAEARFLQTDPVGYGDQMNMYAYVKNDPINSKDPFGEETYNLNLRALGGVFLGPKAETVISFDDENFQLSVTVTGGAGAVEGAFVGGSFTVGESSGEMATNDVSAAVTASATASAGFGPAVTGSVDLTLVEASGSDGFSGPEMDASGNVGAGVGAAAANTIDASLTVKTTIVRDVAKLFGVTPPVEQKIEDPEN